MKRKNVHLVRGEALEALASARRIELVEALMCEQPVTVEQLGRHLGRDPKTLYHHLRPLVAAGLVEEAGEQPTSKRPATLYRLPAERLELDRGDSPRARQLRGKIARSILRSALAQQERAIADPANVLSGRGRNVALGHRVARLTPSGVARVSAKLRELYDLIGESHDERGRPFSFTASLAPTSREED